MGIDDGNCESVMEKHQQPPRRFTGIRREMKKAPIDNSEGCTTGEIVNDQRQVAEETGACRKPGSSLIVKSLLGHDSGSKSLVYNTSGNDPATLNGRVATSTDIHHSKARSNLSASSVIPKSVFEDAQISDAIVASSLPTNYNLEIHKTIANLRKHKARRVCLQFPEGLAMFAMTLSDIFERFVETVEDIIILGDVTYGACCIEDYKASLLDCDFLVHYGHSCLVPVDVTTAATSVRCMYVFVEIDFNVEHFVETIKANFDINTKLALAGTIQFTSGVYQARSILLKDHYVRENLIMPQAKPLSSGEVLGCTAPKIIIKRKDMKQKNKSKHVVPIADNVTVVDKETADGIVFVADGRFHLEAIMIANPTVPAYRYDPYVRKLTREYYDQQGMRQARQKAVEEASTARHFGLILGTLGRQGNPAVMRHIESRLQHLGLPYTIFLMSELAQSKLDDVDTIDAWIQICCPRLSIDWGEKFRKPLLSTYEAEVCLGFAKPWWVSNSDNVNCDSAALGGISKSCKCTGNEDYPMDYYSKEGGQWCSTYHRTK